ncbi:hypothetical protein PsalMR5_02089 [Piscirickettsia salmonis]|uniref:hypothetical protein n=1 Tax=Piscirickettsia salmonis TaxID=1238 RepID=UPI0012BB043C|nr:hypothetical protein [Piscirickettsia salmonis]QGP54578.1 hypothetical protein PsalSR1_02019 [Piscirickettsia salmonis]QGP59540.1 hypothetical protein PsalBI1_02128 [Piscirickettsia salmonis]QGP64223.1 hypothetical protein PsalMR5_02089 [Piscirickettsia salmonis]
MQDLGLNQNYIEKALDNPEKGNLIKVFLEAGLDRAISNAQQRGNQKKLAMARFFKSKVETEEPQIVLKNAAHVLTSRKTPWNPA